jgi:hypothetical protein
MQNCSQPIGVINWFQDNDAIFSAQSGSATPCIGANFKGAKGVGTITNWQLIPEIGFSAIDTLGNHVRWQTGSTFPVCLRVCYSAAESSLQVGTLATDVGDFTNLALDINPSYAASGCPQDLDPVLTRQRRD